MLAYSPSVEAYVQLESGKVLDVSKDIVSGSVSRVTDGASTAQLTLANEGNKYHGVFTPMDKIVIFTTKWSRIQLFAGYLDTVPLISLWGGNVTITATDGIKLLQQLYWDATMYASSALYAGDFNSALTTQDAGMAQAAINILREVAKWPTDRIFITEIPEPFFNWAAEMMAKQQADTASNTGPDALKALLTAGANTSGSTAGGWSAGGCPSGVPKDIFTAIDAAAKKAGIETALALAVSKCESGFRPNAINSANSNGTKDYGLFQLNSATKGHADFFPPSTKWSDPAINADVGCAHLNGVLKGENGNIVNALRRYNGGPRWASVPRTEKYAEKVMGFYNTFKGEMSAENSGGFSASGTMFGATVQAAVDRSNPTPTNKPKYQSGNSGRPGTKGTGFNGLQKPFEDALTLMFADAKSQCGYKISGNGWRSYEAQVALKKQVGKWAATPGNSNHGWGCASDLRNGRGQTFTHSMPEYKWVRDNCKKYGLTLRLDNSKTIDEPWHIEPLDVKAAYYGGPIDPSSSDGTSTGADTASGVKSPLEGAFFMLYTAPMEKAESFLFQGTRAYINDEMVWLKVKELLNASMRSVSTSPDGSLIAWFPDKFGVYARTPYFVIEDIELRDMVISKSDLPMVTHSYYAGGMGGGGTASGMGVTEYNWLWGNGIVTIEMEGLMDSILNLSDEDAETYKPQAIYERYGMRPLKNENASVNFNSAFPFMMALWQFMEAWSKQYNTRAEFTYMPELFPGGRVLFASHGIEMYVESVTHSFDYSGGFSTNASLSCPVSTGKGLSKGMGFTKSQKPPVKVSPVASVTKAKKVAKKRVVNQSRRRGKAKVVVKKVASVKRKML
jgi:soluble lytic murein transglycosylase-like protein